MGGFFIKNTEGHSSTLLKFEIMMQRNYSCMIRFSVVRKRGQSGIKKMGKGEFAVPPSPATPPTKSRRRGESRPRKGATLTAFHDRGQ